VDDSERNFTELISSIERSRSEVTQLIRDQENAAVSRAEGLLKQLEKEIDDLRRRNTELEQLSNTDDHIHFLLVTEPEKNIRQLLNVSLSVYILMLFVLYVFCRVSRLALFFLKLQLCPQSVPILTSYMRGWENLSFS